MAPRKKNLSLRDSEIAGRFHQLLKEHGRPARLISEELDVSLPTMNSYRYGNVPMRFWFAVRFCQFYEMSLEWLATGLGPVDSNDSLEPLLQQLPSSLLEAIPGNTLLSHAWDLILEPVLRPDLEDKEAVAISQKLLSKKQAAAMLAQTVGYELLLRWAKLPSIKVLEEFEKLDVLGRDFSSSLIGNSKSILKRLRLDSTEGPPVHVEKFISSRLGVSMEEYWRLRAVHKSV